MPTNGMRMAGAALVALLLVTLSASSISARAEIGVSSPSLDNLIVVPGQEFLVGIGVCNKGDNVFVVHLEATEGLPVTFAKNDFELMAGTSVQVKTTFRIPDGWQMGEVREGEISVTALTPEGPAEGAASAHVLGSISKHVVIRVGEEPSVPEEPWEPATPLNLKVSLGVEHGAPKPDNIFRQDEVLLVIAEVDGEADVFFVFYNPHAGDVQVPMDKESKYYVGTLDLGDVAPGTYLLKVVARRGDVEEEAIGTFQVGTPVSGFPGGLVATVAVVLVAVFGLFATRRKWLPKLKKNQPKEQSHLP